MNGHEDTFASRLKRALEALAPEGRLERVLAIHCGEASKAQVETLASRRKRGVLTLLLATAIKQEPAKDSLKKIAAARGILLESFDKSGFLRERIFSAVDATRAANATLAGDKALAQEDLLWLRTALADAFEKRIIRARTVQTRLRCAIANLPYINHPGRMELPSFPPSEALVVCGAGPSLTSHLPLLKEAQGRVVVVCAGRALKSLLDAGITPDYVVDIEQNAQQYWPRGVKLPSVLVAHESISPVVAESFSKFIWTDSGANPLRAFLSACAVQLPSIPANGPVASIAAGFAIACGARSIALCGYDFALAPDGTAYADGKGSLDKGAAQGVMVASVAGGQVETLPHFETMRRDLESSLDILRKAGLAFEILNCSPFGAHIAGTLPMPFASFLQRRAQCAKTPCEPVMAPFSTGLEKAALDELEKAAAALAALDRLVKHAKALVEAFAQENPSRESTMDLERGLERLFADELATRTQPGGSELSNNAFEQARLLAEQWPKTPHVNELFAKRAFCSGLLDQCVLHDGFLKDAVAELRKISDPARAYEPAPDVHRHPALKRFATERLLRSNKELSLRLAHSRTEGAPAGFELFHKLLSPPIVLSMPLADGGTLRLADVPSYKDQIEAGAAKFLKDSAFDQARDAIVLFAHVNWGLATELAFRRQACHLIVVYPWFQLLNYMSETCEFLGLLPEDSLVVCPSPECPGWLETLKAKLAAWRPYAKRIMLLENEATAELPELQEIRAALKSALG